MVEEIDVMTGLDDVQTPLEGVEGVEALETEETVALTEAPSNFLDKPFSDYTPTEGLLLLILLVLVLSLLGGFVRRCFGWL